METGSQRVAGQATQPARDLCRIRGASAGALIGAVGGLVGLGGAEFRLPVLVGVFGLPTLDAVVLNKAMSLTVVMAALVFRTKSIPITQLAVHWDVAANLLAGSLLGAWWGAGHAIKMPRVWLDRIIMTLLVLLSLLIVCDAIIGVHGARAAILGAGATRVAVGVIAGFAIGIVAALLGVAGGELLIPTIVLLYGPDVKIAGSLSLAISLPTMIVGFARYSRSSAFAVLRRESCLLRWMAVGSVVGAALGGLLVGLLPTQWLMGLLGLILLVSAIKIFQHAR